VQMPRLVSTFLSRIRARSHSRRRLQRHRQGRPAITAGRGRARLRK
jgi:hypothetical protein